MISSFEVADGRPPAVGANVLGGQNGYKATVLTDGPPSAKDHI